MPLTLDEAVIIALRDNRSIMLKDEDIKKAKAKISEGHADLFPALTFSGAWEYTQGYYSKDIGQTNTQFDLRQNIYTGGKTFNTIKYNGYQFEVTKAILDKAKIETIESVKKGMYTLLLAQEFSKLNKAMVDNGKEHLKYIQDKYKAGEVSNSEVLQSGSSLSSLEEVYESSLNQVFSAQASLNNLLYLDKNINIIAQGELNFSSKDIAYDESLLKALSQRSEIKQYEAQLKSDKSAIEIAKSGGRPTIYASWDYYSRSHAVTTTVNTRNWNDYNVFGVNFSWPVFDGWLTKAKVEQAVIDLKHTQILKEKTMQDIALELKVAYLSLKDSIAKAKTTKSEALVYEDNYRSVKDKYTRGELSSLDKSDASIKYDIARFNLRQAAFDYMTAKASFDKATGQEAVVWPQAAKATGGF
jgi:outer membrane protein TolC